MEGESMTRKSYTAQHKLEVVQFAKVNGNRAAGKKFNVNESSVRCWRKSEEVLKKLNRGRRALRYRKCPWPEIEKELRDWVIIQRSKGSRLPIMRVLYQACEIAREKNIQDFKAHLSWGYRFLARNNLSGRASASIGQELPVVRKAKEEGGMTNGTAEADKTAGVVAETLRPRIENVAALEVAAKEVNGFAATANCGSMEMRKKESPVGAASRSPSIEELQMSLVKKENSAESSWTKPSPIQPSTVPASTTPLRLHSRVSPPHLHPGHGVRMHQGGATSKAGKRVGQMKQRQRSFQSRMEERSGRSTTVSCSTGQVSINSVADALSADAAPISGAVYSSETSIVSSRIYVGEVPAPTAVTRRPVIAYASDTTSQRRVAAQFSSWQEPIPDGDSVNVTPQMYRELRERVEQLEHSLEIQSERFTQMLNQLKEQLDKERERTKICFIRAVSPDTEIH